jgi:hypothetical protein
MRIEGHSSRLRISRTGEDPCLAVDLVQSTQCLLSFRSIAQLNDVKRKRREELASRQGDLGYAMDWIDKNRDQFERNVYFPPAVEVDITDPKYTRVVEGCVGRAAMFVRREHIRDT